MVPPHSPKIYFPWQVVRLGAPQGSVPGGNDSLIVPFCLFISLKPSNTFITPSYKKLIVDNIFSAVYPIWLIAKLRAA